MHQGFLVIGLSRRHVIRWLVTVVALAGGLAQAQVPPSPNRAPQAPKQPSQPMPGQPKPAPDSPEAHRDFDAFYSYMQTSGQSPVGLAEGAKRAGEFAKKYPGTALSYAALGEVRYTQYRMTDGCGMGDDVTMLARKAVDINPKLAEGHILAAKVALCTRDPSLHWHAEQAVKLQPEKPEALFVWARALEVAGDFKASEAAFRKNINSLQEPVRKSNIYFWLGGMLTSDNRLRDDLRADLGKIEDVFHNMVRLDPLSVMKKCTLFSFLARFKDDTTEAQNMRRPFAQEGVSCNHDLRITYLDYVVWAKRYQAGQESAASLKRIQAESGISVDQAFVLSARYMARGDVVRALLNARVVSNIDTIGDGNDRGLDGCCQAVVNAAYQGDVKLVDLLLKNGANVNAAADAKRTPLVYALMNEDVRMTELLLAKGARPNILYDDGVAPLDPGIRAKHHSPELVALLLKNRADPKAKSRGEPVLLLAMSANNLDAVKQLLTRGADPNVKVFRPNNPNDYISPVTQAIQFLQVEMMAALLDAGARPEVPTMSALQYVQGSIAPIKEPELRAKMERIRDLLAARNNKSAK